MAEVALPAPLTPAECDLRGLPFMPLDVVRLLDSDLFALATGEEFKAALALWCKAWLQVPAASLPDDDRVLAHLSGAGSRWKKIKPMALKGWVRCSDNRWYHPVVAEKAADAWKHRQAQRERANKRWGNAEAKPSGNATASATAHATASPAAMQGTGTVKGQKEKSPPSPPMPDDVRAIMEATGWTHPPGDIALRRQWYDLGATLDQDIVPVLRRESEKLKAKGSPPRLMKVFDGAIREKLEADQREIEHLRKVARRNMDDPASKAFDENRAAGAAR
jgi:uncharacterized protein YdaU (DUF1376 family)